jgi:hypothetical protein
MFPAVPFLVTLLDRVKAIVRRVTRPVVARPAAECAQAASRAAPGDIGAGRPIPTELRGLMGDWMSRRLKALSALMRRIEAGETLPAPAPAGGGRPTAAALGRVVSAPLPPEERLPRGFGWMCAFSPTARHDGVALTEWLNEPWMKAKVLAEPERMARLIGPLLSATGERRPDWCPRLPKKARLNAAAVMTEEGESGRGASAGLEDRMIDPGSSLRADAPPPTCQSAAPRLGTPRGLRAAPREASPGVAVAKGRALQSSILN